MCVLVRLTISEIVIFERIAKIYIHGISWIKLEFSKKKIDALLIFNRCLDLYIETDTSEREPQRGPIIEW